MAEVDIKVHNSILKYISKVLLNKSTDRDDLCPKPSTCTFTFEIAISPTQYFRIITVSLDITDITDNKPRFVDRSIAVNHGISSSEQFCGFITLSCEPRQWLIWYS